MEEGKAERNQIQGWLLALHQGWGLASAARASIDKESQAARWAAVADVMPGNVGNKQLQQRATQRLWW